MKPFPFMQLCINFWGPLRWLRHNGRSHCPKKCRGRKFKLRGWPCICPTAPGHALGRLNCRGRTEWPCKAVGLRWLLWDSNKLTIQHVIVPVCVFQLRWPVDSGGFTSDGPWIVESMPDNFHGEVPQPPRLPALWGFVFSDQGRATPHNPGAFGSWKNYPDSSTCRPEGWTMVDFFGTLVDACGWLCVKATLKNRVVECWKMTLALYNCWWTWFRTMVQSSMRLKHDFWTRTRFRRHWFPCFPASKPSQHVLRTLVRRRWWSASFKLHGLLAPGTLHPGGLFEVPRAPQGASG